MGFLHRDDGAGGGIIAPGLLDLNGHVVEINVIALAGLFADRGSDADGYAAGAGPLVGLIWLAAISFEAPGAVTRLAAGPAGR